MKIIQEGFKELFYKKEITKNQNSFNVKSNYKYNIVWKNVIAMIYLHFGGLYGCFLFFKLHETAYTSFWYIFMGLCTSMGITAGAHRLWCHRTYKAKWPLRFLLMLSQTLAYQNHIYEWVRDHRVHHKFTDTDADPHNARRGFFFSHIGWLLVRKHPDVIKKGATVDMSDLEKDPIVVFQRRWYYVLLVFVCIIIPVWIPCYFWNEKFITSWYMNLGRYVWTLNSTWLVNSAAHMWGMKPYDVNIQPTENLFVSLFAFGEGWHNYHHVFPWDYKTGELGGYKTNLTTAFIDFCALLGQAYDLKTVPEEMIAKRIARTGNESSCNKNEIIHHHEDMKWGWSDKDMKPHEIEETRIFNKKD